MHERDIFLAALEIADPSERSAYVKQACGTNSTLRAQVEELLRTHAETSQFLETPAPVMDSEVAQTVITDSTASNKSSPDDDDDPRSERMSGEAEFRKYLQPATRPGWLGRLAHYEIEQILGRGAFGIVAKAFDEKLHRVVAIKLMNPELASTSPPRKRFLREARTAAAVTHENIVAIHAVEEEPIPYLVMEYVPGQTLQQRMDEHGPFEAADVLRIGQQVAAGMAAAHAMKLIHRDIKPANILLTGGINERAKISDFGLARAVDDATMTSSGLIAGTPMYMAPEQARGEDLDHRADLFSLGSVLYQMVSGRPPFRAANTVAVLKRVCEDTPRALEQVIPGTPVWLGNIIFKLMEKDREQRYQSAQEVADLFARCLNELQLNGYVSIAGEASRQSETRRMEPLPETDSQANAPAEFRKTAERSRTQGVLLGLLMGLAALVLVLVVAPRTSRWFKTPIPALPVVEDQGGLRFDGKDDWVEITGLDWRYPQYTIEAFVTSAAQSDHGTIAFLGNSAGQATEWMSLFDGPQTDPGKRISGAGIQGKTPYDNAYGPLTPGIRQHRALVFNGRTLDYFINGVWQGQRTAESLEGLEWNMQALRIGCDGEQRKFFQGTIDQLRISRVARYSQNFPPITSFNHDATTLALYDFDEGQGQTLTDTSGNGHNGTLHGGTWIVPKSGKSSTGAGKASPATAPALGWHGWPADAPKPAIAPFDAAQAKKHQEEWAAYLKVPVEYTNSIGMKFRLIPPGEFLMGSTPEEIEASLKVSLDDKQWKESIQSEAPQQKVILTQPIYLGLNEVTQAEYEHVMGVNPSHFAPLGMGKEAVAGLGTADHPVESVSWNDAAEFCSKLSQQEKLKPFYFRAGETITPLDGTGYCLPSETEWEFACRAGTATKHWIGDKSAELVRAGWLGPNAGDRTHAVRELGANPFGLFDVHGNVWEWVQDTWDATDFGQIKGQPSLNSNSQILAGSQRPMRGGGWFAPVSLGRSSSRLALNPQGRYNFAGFRLSLPVDAVKQALKSQSTPDTATTTGWHGWPADAPKPAIAPFDAAQAKQHQDEWAAYLKVPVEYTNSIGMKFRLIPPGEFLMGSTPEEIAAALKVVGENKHWQECVKSEAPQHKVILTQPIYLGVNEVTQAEYEQEMGVNPSHFAPMGMGKEAVAGLDTTKHPVETVSWNNAAEFCDKLSKQEKFKPLYFRSGETMAPFDGSGYRLPSEAEWEFACRAGTATKYWIGDQDEDLVRAGWFGGYSGGRTHAAGELKANPFGLSDIHGNVWEWVQDGWDATYYGQFAEKPAIYPGTPLPTGSLHVLRGGDWATTASNCRSSNRYAHGPATRTDYIGFRVALSVDAVKQALKAQTEPASTGWHGWPAEAPKPAIAPFDVAQAKQHQEEWAAYLKVPVEYTNSIGMKFMLIPPGEFLMGSTPEEIAAALKDVPPDDKYWRECIQSEAPQHKVILTQPLYLGVNEVKQAEYEKVMGVNPSHFAPMGAGKEAVAGLETAGHPVEMVSWNDAAEFCAKLSKQEKMKPFYFRVGETITPLDGTGYRLPSEAEWEFACRAGTATKYWIGDQDEDLVRAGWFGGNSGDRTHATGELKANPFGLFDMHGNVWEWVQDGWEASYYGQLQEKPATNPNGPFSAKPQRVMRGGDWNYIASNCRSSLRVPYEPTGRIFDIGFRVSLPVDAVRNKP